MGNFRKTISYLKRNGLKKTYHMVLQRLAEGSLDEEYEIARLKQKADEETLAAQRSRSFDNPPLISILIPAYETNEEYLRILLDGILIQSYESFEVILADASSTSNVSQVAAEYDDERICYIKLEGNGGISENTNAALARARGDVVAFCDHDDFLEPDALYHIARAFEKGALFAYTDEDKYDSGKYYRPNIKPDFNLDLLLSNNYICHLCAVKTEIAKAVGGFRAEYDGAQDYDFILRCCQHILGENIQNEDFHHMDSLIVHIPRVLYHWRVHEKSTADNPSAKLYAYEAGKRALQSYLDERKICAAAEHTEHRGFYRVNYQKSDAALKLRYNIPEDIIPEDADYKALIEGIFQRPEVKMVVFRVLDAAGLVESEPYKGMKEWDSGIMHRSHMSQNIEEVSGCAWCVNEESEGHLIVYVPYIRFRRKVK